MEYSILSFKSVVSLAMDLQTIKKYFHIYKGKPDLSYLESDFFHSIANIEIEGTTYNVELKDNTDSVLFEYLKNPNDYKAKEALFGVIIEDGYARLGVKEKAPVYLQLVLPKPWVISDKNITRELAVVISNSDQSNDSLRHEMYRRTRSIT
jgi:hypothetical protein